ncbi:MAG: hypothetical protein JHC98_05970 [Thermoleophilaceae bacterium]|nr:hypothetical protein [Thermoleophilaceae bacterium]
MSESLFDYDCDQGVRYVCGADESGRGSIAGPLVVAAVRFDYERLDANDRSRMGDLNDGKKLSPRRRARLMPVIFELADTVATVAISARQIEKDGLDASNMRAFGRVLESVDLVGSVNLVDGSARLEKGFELKGVGVDPRLIERGDQTSAAIAAASIVAQETHNLLMRQLDVEYPGYGFAAHMGYVTIAHVEAVRKLGPSPAHRHGPTQKALSSKRVPEFS